MSIRVFIVVLIWLCAAIPAYGQSEMAHNLSNAQVEVFNKCFNKGNALSGPYIFIADVKSKTPNKKELKQAIKAYDCALNLVPNHWPTLFFKGKTYQALDDHRQAYDMFKHTYEFEKNNKDVLNEYMVEAMQTNKFAEAVKFLKPAQDRFSDDIGIRGNYAFALVLSGQIDEGILALKRVEEKWPNDPITKQVLKRALKVQSGAVQRPKTLAEFQAVQ